MLITILFWTAIVVAFLASMGFMTYELEAPFAGLFFFAPLVTFLVGLFAFGIIALVTSATYTQDTWTLKSLNTTMGVEGASSNVFFVGSGYIESTPVYSFYTEVAPNEFRLVTVNADSSRIIETESKPEAVCTVDLVDTPAPFGDDLDVFLSDPYYAEACTFYVPAGSVANTINPNLGE